MIDSSEPEIPLFGGDVTEGIVRVGDTVRRPVKRNAAFVHALLQHLEAVGFDGAPRYLGVDAAGREVLTFIEGELAGRPHPAWIGDEDRLASIGRLLRRYDDATVGFVAPAEAAFVPPLHPEGLPPAPELPEEVIAHLDITPENLIFRDGTAHALIDFDLARPGARVDELYNAMLWWAPLNDPGDLDPGLRGLDAPRRCRILADAYGMSEADRLRLVEVAFMRTRRSWHLMKHHAEVEGGGWRRMWDEGVGDVITRREAWLERNGSAVEAALTAA
ncbi:phosphotransferase [Actinospica robiniae]|uniref:phosphotransferase n=1 Tax=Actinospica robiniae TaxID=304901 RepID=UPI000408A8D1|nr:phosphotransferase [Actinospica robiniae]